MNHELPIVRSRSAATVCKFMEKNLVKRQILGKHRRASSYLSPLSCSQWLNILPSPDRSDDGVAFRVERDGRDVRPVARVA